MISSQDALSLLNKWNQESSKLRCTIVGAGLRSTLTGTLFKVDPDEAFALQASDGESWIMVSFNRVTFLDYGDSRSVDNPELKERANEYAGMLSMQTDSGTLLVIGELK